MHKLLGHLYDDFLENVGLSTDHKALGVHSLLQG